MIESPRSRAASGELALQEIAVTSAARREGRARRDSRSTSCHDLPSQESLNFAPASSSVEPSADDDVGTGDRPDDDAGFAFFRNECAVLLADGFDASSAPCATTDL